MTTTRPDDRSGPRPLPATGRGPVLERGGHVVYADRRLGDLVSRRPPGVTGHQWSTAGRASLDLVVCAAGTGRPEFVVEIGPPAVTSEARREVRMRAAVCAAVGLSVLRIESATLRPGPHGRRVVEYLIDARDYTAGMAAGTDPADPTVAEPVGFRDIVGRLPDGRRGHVNDLGAIARAAAVEAYVARQLADPILRGLHVRWTDGSAEGWGWVEVRPGLCLVERVRLYPQRFSCGVETDRLAADLAAAAVGERLRSLDAGAPAEPALVSRARLGEEVDRLRARRDDMSHGFDFDHLTFD